jgi:hypothetical protein
MGIAADDSRHGERQARAVMPVWLVLTAVFFGTFRKAPDMMAVSALDRWIDGARATAVIRNPLQFLPFLNTDDQRTCAFLARRVGGRNHESQHHITSIMNFWVGDCFRPCL